MGPIHLPKPTTGSQGFAVATRQFLMDRVQVAQKWLPQKKLSTKSTAEWKSASWLRWQMSQLNALAISCTRFSAWESCSRDGYRVYSDRRTSAIISVSFHYHSLVHINDQITIETTGITWWTCSKVGEDRAFALKGDGHHFWDVRDEWSTFTISRREQSQWYTASIYWADSTLNWGKSGYISRRE